MCPCGSGKKFKNCCVNKSPEYIEIMYLFRTQSGVFDHKQEELVTIIQRCEVLLEKGKFSAEEKENLYMNLLQIYNLAGYDKKVIAMAKDINIEKKDDLTKISILLTCMRSYENTGEMYSAYHIVRRMEHIVSELEWGDTSINALKSGAMLEIGKFYNIAFLFMKEDGKELDESFFLNYYDALIEAYENGKYDDIDHYTGALSNKGAYYLQSNDTALQEKGLKLMNKSYKEKVRVGNWNGIANDFSRLGTYYLEHKKYKEAMAYTQRDLQIARRYGSLRDVITSLLNLTKIYMDTYQLSDARYSLQLIEKSALQIGYTELEGKVAAYRNKINEIAIECKNKGIVIGKKTPCVCGSGKTYGECCGVADMDYMAIEKVLGLDHMIPYGEFELAEGEEWKKFCDEKDLRTILRKMDSGQIRLSWTRLFRENGVDYLYELPDMSSIHLVSAKKQLENYKTGELLDEVSVALSAVMLSISALEAFLNQLVFFLKDLPDANVFEKSGFKIPEEIKNDCGSYQRNKGFSDKLNEVLNIYTLGKWNRAAFKRYDDLFKFIKIRNELVHFKSVEFYLIIPAEKNDILDGLPKEIELRDVMNAWPLKLLTDSFAGWGIRLVEETIDYIKETFQNKPK